jgi:uncharacterized membrane protein
MKSAAACVILSGIVLWLLTRKSSNTDEVQAEYSTTLRQNFMAFAMIFLGSLAWYLDSDRMLLFYPVLMNIVLFTLFFGSLFARKTVVERLARIKNPDLSMLGVAYTRNVTKIWCIFFVVNGSIAVFTAQYASLAVWALYNGVIAYLLMGLLFVVEYLFRIRVMRDGHDTS